MKLLHRLALAAAGLLAGAALCGPAVLRAQPVPEAAPPRAERTYSRHEILDVGHRIFGRTTAGLAEAVEHVFRRAGLPNAYIVGEEAAGAFFGGVRYGEGVLHPKAGGTYRVYWQGPSVGFDVGGNGSRVLVLVYNLASPNEIFDRFLGVEGSAYLVGGLGVNFQRNDRLQLAPIRTGVGARLGANVGYLKYTPTPDWNPF